MEGRTDGDYFYILRRNFSAGDKKNELPKLGFELQTSRFLSESANPSATVNLFVHGLKKTILFYLGFVTTLSVV
jgi:hypothetical protein